MYGHYQTGLTSTQGRQYYPSYTNEITPQYSSATWSDPNSIDFPGKKFIRNLRSFVISFRTDEFPQYCPTNSYVSDPCMTAHPDDGDELDFSNFAWLPEFEHNSFGLNISCNMPQPAFVNINGMTGSTTTGTFSSESGSDFSGGESDLYVKVEENPKKRKLSVKNVIIKDEDDLLSVDGESSVDRR